MTRRRRAPSLLLAASLLAAALASPARAWDDHGHMLIAAAAWDRLAPAVQARVDALLQLNQYPVNGDNDVAPALAAKARFMQAATAPDAIKDRGGYVNDGNEPPPGPAAGQNIGFGDRLMHKYWHYRDIPFSTDGTSLHDAPAVNAQERIALFRRTLASDAPDALKAFDLVWLLHLVGDVHQPLHATSRYSRDLPMGDAGGNRVTLCAPACGMRLHAFWDGLLGSGQSLAAAIAAGNALPAPDATLAGEMDEAAWLQESFEIARSFAYAPPVGVGTPPYTLTADYAANARAQASHRAALAAARLARLLNAELK